MFDGWEANTGRICAFAQQPISGRAAFAKRRVGHYKKSDSDPGCQLRSSFYEVNNYHLQNPKMYSKNTNKTKKRMTPLEFAPAAPKVKAVKKKKSFAAKKVEEVLPVLATSKDLPPVPPVGEHPVPAVYVPPVPAVDQPPVPAVAEPLPDVAEPPVPDVAEPSGPSGVVPGSVQFSMLLAPCLHLPNHAQAPGFEEKGSGCA